MRVLTGALLVIALAGCAETADETGDPAPLPLVLNSAQLQDARAGVAYRADLAATGGNGSLVWDIESGALPPGMQLAGAALEGTPTQHGDYPFVVRVTDASQNTATSALSLRVRPAQAITISTTLLPAAMRGNGYNGAIQTSGGSGAGYAWTLTAGSLPPGMQLVPGTPDAVLAGTPTQAGNYLFTVEVADSLGDTANQAVAIIVTFAPLEITTTTLPIALTTAPYQAHIVSSGGTGQGQAWSIIAGALPAGITFGPGAASAVLQGTASFPGAYDFTVQLVDSNLNVSTRQLLLQVSGPTPLVITTASLFAGMENSNYAQQLTVTGGTAPYTWAVTQGALPDGLAIFGDTIAGVPTRTGTFPLTLEVRDAGVFVAAQPFSLHVGAPPFAFLTGHILAPAAENEFYTQVLAYSGSLTTVTTARLVAGTLPPGMSIGQDSWWLSANSIALAGLCNTPGQYNFVIEIEDSSSATTRRSFEMQVYPSSGPLAVLNHRFGPFPTGEILAPVPLRAIGSAGAVTSWGVSTGVLPTGLAVSFIAGRGWCLTGTPTAPGTFSFSLAVLDSQGSASKSFEVVVGAAPPATTCYGRPVPRRMVFLVSADAALAPPQIADARMELSRAIARLPVTHEFDVVVCNDTFGAPGGVPGSLHVRSLWGEMRIADDLGKLQAIDWIQSPAFDPQGANASYPGLRYATTQYGPALGGVVYVNNGSPSAGGSAAQILADFPGWWVTSPAGTFHVVSYGVGGSTMQYMQNLAALAGGVFTVG